MLDLGSDEEELARLRLRRGPLRRRDMFLKGRVLMQSSSLLMQSLSPHVPNSRGRDLSQPARSAEGYHSVPISTLSSDPEAVVTREEQQVGGTAADGPSEVGSIVGCLDSRIWDVSEEAWWRSCFG